LGFCSTWVRHSEACSALVVRVGLVRNLSGGPGRSSLPLCGIAGVLFNAAAQRESWPYAREIVLANYLSNLSVNTVLQSEYA